MLAIKQPKSFAIGAVLALMVVWVFFALDVPLSRFMSSQHSSGITWTNFPRVFLHSLLILPLMGLMVLLSLGGVVFDTGRSFYWPGILLPWHWDTGNEVLKFGFTFFLIGILLLEFARRSKSIAITFLLSVLGFIGFFTYSIYILAEYHAL